LTLAAPGFFPGGRNDPLGRGYDPVIGSDTPVPAVAEKGAQMKTRERYGGERRRATPPDGRDGGVQTFLDRLARAVTAGDGKTIAAMWAVPGVIIGDRSVRVVGTVNEVEQFFGGARDQYHALGVVTTRAEIQRLEWLTDRIVLVDVRWPYLDARGNERGEESSTYALRTDDTGELRIQAAVMRGATMP
jgi:hypothetical protein